jgi:hypothetical protein
VSIIISFRGMDADQNRLEAFAGTESAAGIARSLSLVAHYAATGTIRRRYPFDERVQFYLEAMEPGSFNWKLVLAVTGTVSIGLATNAIYDLGKLVLARAIGHEDVQVSGELAEFHDSRSGDIDALVEAVEPALKKGHYGIGQTARQIVIVNGSNNQTMIVFDAASKAYLAESRDAEMDEQDVSVSALNVNDRTGRAYFLDLGRTIPFRIASEADPKVVGVLATGLDRYARRTPAPVRITFRRIEAADGRLKRIIILDAEDVSDAT